VVEPICLEGDDDVTIERTGMRGMLCFTCSASTSRHGYRAVWSCHSYNNGQNAGGELLRPSL
jgi:hypothetical protein